MATVKITSDEYYPFYFTGGPSYAPEIEVPDEVLRRWKRVETEFSKMQDEMHEYTQAYYAKEKESD